jgi:hypothetical protein
MLTLETERFVACCFLLSCSVSSCCVCCIVALLFYAVIDGAILGFSRAFFSEHWIETDTFKRAHEKVGNNLASGLKMEM